MPVRCNKKDKINFRMKNFGMTKFTYLVRTDGRRIDSMFLTAIALGLSASLDRDMIYSVVCIYLPDTGIQQISTP
jgi:hypothetical protein